MLSSTIVSFLSFFSFFLFLCTLLKAKFFQKLSLLVVFPNISVLLSTLYSGFGPQHFRKSILFYNIRALCLAQTNSRFSVTIFLKCQEHLTHLSFSYFDFQDITFCCLSPYYIGLPRAFNSPRFYMLEHRDSPLFSLSILIS